MVLFATGDDWDTKSRRFTRNQAFFRFGDNLTFSEEVVSDGVMFSRNEITLYARPDGNVPQQPIDEAAFSNGYSL